MIRCKTCLMPDTRPSTPFIDGECAACANQRASKEIDWDARARDFDTIVIEHCGKNGSGYDCIVPSSGGKDSTAQVLRLINMGMRPLVVTATTCHLTDIGRQNIDNLSRHATTIEYTPNRAIRRKMNRIGLAMVGDISIPEHMAIFSIPFRAAADFGIPLIVYGECPTNEYGGPIGSDKHMEITLRYINEHQGFLGMRPSDFVGLGDITYDDIRDYLLPPEDKMEGIKAVFLGQYFKWNSRINAVDAQHSGMRSRLPCSGNWWTFENMDNAQTGLHDWFGFLKYGYGRACAQTSIDVRTGNMSRGDAADIVRDRDGAFPWEYMGINAPDVLAPLGLTMDEMLKFAAHFTNKSLFVPETIGTTSARLIDDALPDC